MKLLITFVHSAGYKCCY